MRVVVVLVIVIWVGKIEIKLVETRVVPVLSVKNNRAVIESLGPEEIASVAAFSMTLVERVVDNDNPMFIIRQHVVSNETLFFSIIL